MSARTRQSWALLAFALLLGLGAALRPAAQPIAPVSETRAMPAPMRDVAYGPDPAQRFDIDLPARTASAPTVFYVHGGGWAFGDKAWQVDNKRARWTRAGAFFVSTNYRMRPVADPLEQARDVARVLAEAQRVVARAGGDPDRFVLMGHSAGGHLVALLAARPDLVREAGARPWRATVLLDAGSVDVVTTMTSPRGRLRLFRNAFGNDPAFWRAVSPMHQLDSATAPILAVCASERRDSCTANRAFLDKAAGFGTRTQLMAQPLSHAEINRLLGEDNAYTREVERFVRALPGWASLDPDRASR
jgi:arylformamidase